MFTICLAPSYVCAYSPTLEGLTVYIQVLIRRRGKRRLVGGGVVHHAASSVRQISHINLVDHDFNCRSIVCVAHVRTFFYLYHFIN